MKYKHLLYHAIAIITVIIWGTTFVSTKVLINSGLTPVEIMLYRFMLAYLCILVLSHKKLLADTWKDEFLMFLSGLSGGSLYFLAENTALKLTLASNVSLLICTTPIFTILLASVVYKEPLHKRLMYGSLIALVGVGMVVFNGNVILQLNPLGDLLTLAAAVLWAIYCLILRQLGKAYSTLLITRKIFFYGIVSILFYYLFFPSDMHVDLLRLPVVYSNLLFLGIVASMLCYIMWNSAVFYLGASQTSNYIYVIPLVTLLASSLVLDEPLTLISIVGAIFIIGGIYIAERK